MAIRVQCAGCKAAFSVKDDFAGRRGKCPRCQAVVQVPATGPDGPPSPPAAPVIDAAKLDALNLAADDEIAPVSLLPTAQQSAAESNGNRDEGAGYGLAADEIKERRAMETMDKMVRIATIKPVRSESVTAPEVLQAFKGKIKPVRVPFAYRFGILLVATLVLLLPLVYLALIVGVGFGIWYHATHHLGILGAVRGRGAILMVMLYAAPIFSGAILLLFMLKPLFAPRAREGRVRSLRPAAEPLLFAFVEKVCAAVGAPMPKEIQVDNQVNAAAGLGSGIGWMFSSQLVLVIGVPLVAGLTTGQFAGVLAHEFGHFTQGTGTRVTYLIRWIIAWFHRVVEDRDGWDEWLEAAADDLDWRLAVVLGFARACVWLTRRILWVLELIALACAGFMLRQMEYHADLHEIRLAGSKNFESTMRRIGVFSGVFHSTLGQIASTAPAAMVSDLPALASMVMNVTKPEVIHKQEKRLLAMKTHWSDTHPAAAERIAVAKSVNEAGQFDFERGADCLFKDFDALSRNVTLDLYQGVLGTKVKPESLMPPEVYLAKFMDGQHLPRRPNLPVS